MFVVACQPLLSFFWFAYNYIFVCHLICYLFVDQHPFKVSKPLIFFVFSGKTRTSRAQLAMQVLILTLELVSDVICHFRVPN
jgi:hypothetical protein